MTNISEQKQKMKEECNYDTCKMCPFFVLKNKAPICKHQSNYLLDCKLLSLPPEALVTK